MTDKVIELDESDQKQELALVEKLKKRARELVPVWAEFQPWFSSVESKKQDLHDARLLREAAAEIESWMDQKPKTVGYVRGIDYNSFSRRQQVKFVVQDGSTEHWAFELNDQYYLVKVEE